MIKTLVVEKQMTNDEIKSLIGTRIEKGYFKTILSEDADVYTSDGKMLMKFRKNVLNKETIDTAYDSVIKFARKVTTTRGVASGDPTKPKITGKNAKVMSNIMGYFDTTSVRQKWILNKAGMPIPKCRETSFTGKYPEKWKNCIPLVEEIDNQYKLLCPNEHLKQHRETSKTKYQIGNTAFTTISTNLNFQTAIHTDKGDYNEGFGNVIVIERGTYTGGYTGFPQYGICVDVRQGDFLAMDVHEFHANEPIEGEDFDRLSIVSYMREGIVKNCVGEEIVGEDYFRKASKIVSDAKN
jgi:hypothetical protein